MPEHPVHSPLTLETAAQLAREQTLAKGVHLPTLIAEGTQGRVVTQFEPRPTTEARAQQTFLLGLGLAHTARIGVLQQAFFIFEAWM